MRAVIVANGIIDQAVEIPAGDLLIAADGGAKHCLDRDIHPAYVVGDMDSLQPEHLSRLESQGSRLVRYPSRKDQTDLELAMDLAGSLGAAEILILGGLGARWDQTIANLLLSAARSTLKVTLVDGGQEIQFVRSGEECQLQGKPGDVVSLIPLTARAVGITTRNMEYPLAGEDLPFGSTRGVSNVLTASQASVSLTEGILLCTVYHL